MPALFSWIIPLIPSSMINSMRQVKGNNQAKGRQPTYEGANRLIPRNRRPNSINSTGIGTIIAPRHPSSVPAHWMPRLLNICRVNSGKHAPTMDRIIVLAANAEAALVDHQQLIQQ